MGTAISMPAKVRGNLRGVVVFTALTLNTIFWCVPLFVMAVVKLVVPVKRVRAAVTRYLMALGENWVSGNTTLFGLRDRGLLDVRGVEDLNRRAWFLLLSNHQSWVDILVLQAVFNRRIPFLKFFIKQELVWFPFLGIAWWALDMPFMKRYSKSYLAKHPHRKGMDLEATRIACRKFRETPTSIINFIEGTRFSEEKRVRCNSPYDQLLPPRAGGVALALSSMGTMFDHILDVTIVYPRGVTEFWDMCCGQLERVVIDVKRMPVEQWMVEGDYVTDRDYRARFHQWLTVLWKEKDSRIKSLQEA
jgi:1-acyl-sn-glycerol-3-phosphate acyltransferase